MNTVQDMIRATQNMIQATAQAMKVTVQVMAAVTVVAKVRAANRGMVPGTSANIAPNTILVMSKATGIAAPDSQASAVGPSACLAFYSASAVANR